MPSIFSQSQLQQVKKKEPMKRIFKKNLKKKKKTLDPNLYLGSPNHLLPSSSIF
jgi:hypothetical protein